MTAGLQLHTPHQCLSVSYYIITLNCSREAQSKKRWDWTGLLPDVSVWKCMKCFSGLNICFAQLTPQIQTRVNISFRFVTIRPVGLLSFPSGSERRTSDFTGFNALGVPWRLTANVWLRDGCSAGPLICAAGKRLLTIWVLMCSDTCGDTGGSLDRPLYKANHVIVIMRHLSQGGPRRLLEVRERFACQALADDTN